MSETTVGKIEQLTFGDKILDAIDPTRIRLRNYRKEISELNKRICDLERELASLRRI